MRQLIVPICIFLIVAISNIYAQPIYFPKTISSVNDALSSTIADIDQDGEVDVLVANGNLYLMENDGNENFTTHQIGGASGIVSIDYGDMNNDGAIDIVVKQSVSAIRWYENDGNNNFTAQEVGNASLALIIHVVDVDQNGTLDVLTGSSIIPSYWFDNDGNGNFTKKELVDNADVGYATAIAIKSGDMDNDGHMDIISNTDFFGLVWYKNDGNENFTPYALDSDLRAAWGLLVDDINEDGLLDIFVMGRLEGASVVAWYKNNGGGSFTKNIISTDYDGDNAIYTLDWDDDGDKDLISSSTDESVITIWENDGSENFTRHDIISGISARTVNPIDIDGDGDVDIIAAASDGTYLYEACTGTDGDNDGYADQCDCNDNDSSIYPGAPQTCNNEDNDCNGIIDEQEAGFVDGVAPSSVLCNNPTVELDADGEYTFTGSEVFQSGTDDCGIVSFVSASPSMVKCGNAGKTVQVTVTAQDEAGNTATCTSSVTVEDNIQPVIFCQDITSYLGEDDEVNVDIFDIFLYGEDNCGLGFGLTAEPAKLNCSNIGQTPVTLTAVRSGNGSQQVATCTVMVTLIDDDAPYVFCHDITVELDNNGQASITADDIDGGVDAGIFFYSFDNCDFDLSTDVNTFDCDDIGSNQVILTGTDIGGNSTSCTANVTIVEGTSLPAGWQSTDIGQSGTGNDYAYGSCDQEPAYTIMGGGNNTMDMFSDNVAFSSYSICGDGSITAKVESVDPNGYGGLMIRESTDAGAKQVSVFSNMSNILRHESRNINNGMKQVSQFFKPSPIWLKLERQGDWIFAYYSSTGNNFQYVHGVFVPMQSCVEIGLASFTYITGSQTEVVFSNVSITGSNGGFAGNNNTPTPDTDNLITDTFSLSTVNCYPNPNNGQFTLKFDTPLQEDARITIFNAVGQVVSQQNIAVGVSQVEHDLSQQPAGGYLLRIDSGVAEPSIQRIIIQ